ncbi:MAG: MFS transporter [Polyangiaceae bacterium]
MTDVGPVDGRDVRRKILRATFAGSAGNLVEWYDWYAYSAFAIYFAPRFFPRSDRTAQLLDAAALFAIGFLVRPLGALWMGRHSDRVGRSKALTRSVLLMCVGSTLVAVAPTFATAGIGAPAVLVLARVVQGLSVGGEYGASATYLSEIAASGHRGFVSSLQYVTLIGGQLLALGVLVVLQTFLTTEALEAWGWRVPFALGGVLSVAVFVARTSLVETDAFLRSDPETRRERANVVHLLRAHPKEAALVVGLTAGGTVAFYTFTTYLQKLLVVSTGFPKDVATRVTASALVVFMVLQPAVGALSDRVGRRPVMIAFGVGGVLLTIPLLHRLATTPSPLVAFLWATVALLVVSGYTSINAVVKAELFPTEVRTIGVAFPYALATAIFGGTAEWVALALKSSGHESWYGVYVTALVACSLVVYVAMRETRDRGALGTEISSEDPR